ncbi:2-succinyl-5-enolpyruvyl-6-hydroxy-3-cyclohexene- 1-carboxylate synthase [Dictyobacter vulcani]|uniref:2-succinyl-5-enolpyruvyl-6-hydroxy-3-cyclohexene-1-carboxylate synthase n=1 Tax=Dictyobacter vulcani TaxID=2607529 RepID=A0A5J4KKH8_9CHLR|nr:2-succinyl-5-enolpyruvyl-6-hydroxy-3-cyclohexene-1-carboxylic-acid synthase [Dictyobacter vulcani]GER86947.1 2-succinyl-5-enolpyruvyl-6-hydroxy-3-cyclohexene- 1-carboxylate synthase [Dictyobacter vulcani]
MAEVNNAQYQAQIENPTYAYVNAFIDELQRSDVRHVVICPGSRSTPLSLALVAHPAIKVWMHVDERSAAFFALGLAKQINRPVALVCTSGTAAANFLPAVAEAHLTHVPLLLLTADRPHELRETGAPQAIDQNRLYGTHAKWFVEVALPEATNEALRYIRTLANRVAALACEVPAGPVHLNFPFREPLTPGTLANQPLPPLEQRDPIAWQGRPDNQPYVSVMDAPLGTLSTPEVQQLIKRIQHTPHGLIVVGPTANPALTAPLLQLARTLGYPILADPLSQLRGGPHEQSLILSSYDAFLRLETFTDQHVPELVLRFGPMPVAKPLMLYLKRYAHCPQIVIDAQNDWHEPTQLADTMLHTDPVSFCEQLTGLLSESATYQRDEQWLERWQRADRLTRQALYTAIQDFPATFEGRVFTELAELLPTGSTLFAGNSMPIRDMDTFFWGARHSIQTVGNRGANGIDGVISSALGVSASKQERTPTVLVIGDLSFYHDLNGLLAARLHQLDLVVILINNDGGGIFSFLPQAAYPEHFEQVFGTPTGLEFEPVVRMYGGTYQQPADWNAFRQVFQQDIQTSGLHVIELRTERASNVTMHRQLWQIVGSALRKQED